MTPTTLVPHEEFVEGVGDGVVVHGPQHRREDVVVGLGLLEPVVRAGVRRRLVSTLREAREQLVGGIEKAPVRVEREAGDRREDQGAGGPDPRRGVGPHRAAEEDGALGVQGEQFVRTLCQVDGLHAASGE